MNDKYILKRVDDGEEFSISFGSLLVGRSDSCDIRVKTGQASREHARVRAQDNGVVVEDLHSTNGTFVNDKQIEEATLVKPGDVIRFDQERFSLQEKGLTNATIYARPVNPNDGAMSIEEEDEEDVNATVYRQSFVMPANWQSFDDSPADNSTVDDRKKQALNNFINKSFRALQGNHLIALVIFKDNEPPIIKTVSTGENEGRWSIGRNKSCDIVVEQPDISEVHCHLVYENGQWSLEDNQSTNGIWLNNKRKTSLNLQSNQNLHLASLKLEVTIENRE